MGAALETPDVPFDDSLQPAEIAGEFLNLDADGQARVLNAIGRHFGRHNAFDHFTRVSRSTALDPHGAKAIVAIGYTAVPLFGAYSA